jgi:hypothetical protein
MDDKGAPSLGGRPERRTDLRHPVRADASLRREGSGNYRVRVFDMSRNGCKVEIVERPHVAEGVWVKFDGLEAMHATVAWVDPPLAGLHFDRQIHPAVFDLLMTRLSLHGSSL